MGKVGLAILNNSPGGGRIANAFAQFGINTNSRNVTLDQLGRALMTAHTEAVNWDVAERVGRRLGVLSTDQINRYHKDVFVKQLGLPLWSYGGYWPTGFLFNPLGDSNELGVR